MKTVVLSVVCSNCLQDRDCVGTGGQNKEWVCKECIEKIQLKNKTEILVQAGWVVPVDRKLIFRIETRTEIIKTYEVEAEDEDEARDIFQDDGVLVDEDESFGEEIESIELIKQKHDHE